MPSFRAAQAPTLDTDTSHSLTIPAGAEEGDLLVLIFTGVSATVPAPWGAPVVDAGDTVVWCKACAAGEPGSAVTVTKSVSGFSTGAIAAYSSARTSSPIDATAYAADTRIPPPTSVARAPEIDTPHADDIILSIFECNGAGVVPGATMTSLSTMTQRFSVGGGSFAWSLALFDYPGAASGVNASRSVQMDSPQPWEAIQLAIRHVNRAPNDGTIVGPATGAVLDLENDGYPFVGAFSDPDTGDTPSARAFRRKVGAGAYEYTDDEGATWGSALVWETSSSVVWDFEPGTWLNGDDYEASVAFKDADGEAGGFGPDITITASAPPTVTITEGGTETSTSRPVVEWSTSDPDADPQDRWQVIVETGDVDVEPGIGDRLDASGIQTGTASSWTPTVDHPSAGRVRRFVRASAGGQWSAWAYDDVEMDIEPPAAPTLVGVYDPATNSTTLTVTGTHDRADFPDTTFVVTRDGVPVRGASALPGSGLGDMRLALPGLDGHYASTPDDASLDVTGDLTLRWFGKRHTTDPADQALLAKLGPGAHSYALWISAGKPRLNLAAVGTDPVVGVSSVGPVLPLDTRIGIAMEWRASDGRVQFFLADDPFDPDGTTWTQHGTNRVLDIGGTIATTTAPVSVGALGDGTQSLNGEMVAASIRSGIEGAGTVVLDVDFSDADQGWEMGDSGGATGTDGTGKTVTIHGAGSEVIDVTPQTVVDYEAPPFEPVAYEARTVASTPALVASEPSSAVEVTTAPTSCRLLDPLDPGSGIAVRLVSFDRSRIMPAQEWQPEGRDDVVVTYGRARGYRGTLTIGCDDQASFDAVWDLLLRRRTLLAQTMHAQYYLAVNADVGEADVLASADVTEPWPTRHAHTLTVPAVEVAAP